MRGGPSSVLGNRHVKRCERKIVFEDKTNLNGWCMSQLLRTGEFYEIELTKRNEENLLEHL